MLDVDIPVAEDLSVQILLCEIADPQGILTDMEREVLNRKMMGMTLDQIAQTYGFSRERARHMVFRGARKVAMFHGADMERFRIALGGQKRVGLWQIDRDAEFSRRLTNDMNRRLSRSRPDGVLTVGRKNLDGVTNRSQRYRMISRARHALDRL